MQLSHNRLTQSTQAEGWISQSLGGLSYVLKSCSRNANFESLSDFKLMLFEDSYSCSSFYDVGGQYLCIAQLLFVISQHHQAAYKEWHSECFCVLVYRQKQLFRGGREMGYDWGC